MRRLIELCETDIDLVVRKPEWASSAFLETVLAVPLPSWPEGELRDLWLVEPAEADRLVQTAHGAKDRYHWFLERFYVSAGWSVASESRKDSGRRAWMLVAS